VKQASGKSDNALDSAIARGEFPAPVKIGPRSVGWYQDEIIRWQEDRTLEREVRRQRLERERAELEAPRSPRHREARNT
jgi:prophage regulatory protein